MAHPLWQTLVLLLLQKQTDQLIVIGMIVAHHQLLIHGLQLQLRLIDPMWMQTSEEVGHRQLKTPDLPRQLRWLKKIDIEKGMRLLAVTEMGHMDVDQEVHLLLKTPDLLPQQPLTRIM